MNNETTSDTPETDALRQKLSGKGWSDSYMTMMVHANKLERERDELRNQLREERQLHVQTLAERDEARKLFQSSKRARASLSEACDHLQAERDTAQAALATTRDVLCDTLPDANVPTAELARMICGAWTRAMDSLKPGGMLDIFLTRAAHDRAAAIRERDEARKTLEETRQGICDWEQTEDGQWLTDCGNAFEFTEGSPIYNDFICCPYCRKNLTETPYVDDADSDN